MTLAILLACIPFALGVGLLWGFALGCLTPTASRRPSKRAARQAVWECHWAANRDTERRTAEQAYALGLNTQGDLALHRMHAAELKRASEAEFEAEEIAARAEWSSARMAGDTFKQANE
jgi:hypothetical protein